MAERKTGDLERFSDKVTIRHRYYCPNLAQKEGLVDIEGLALTSDDEVCSGVVLYDGLVEGAESFINLGLQLEFISVEMN